MMDRTCTCGSGLPRYDLTDAAGIFCRYVCERCEKEARSHYNPAIFASGSHYAASGEEEDIFRDEPDDGCSSPNGHSWVYTGTAYGGDDESYFGEGRCYCEFCGADGDA